MRLIVSCNGVQIKVELSPLSRGTVYEPQLRAVCETVEDEFGYVEVPLVSLADLYAGRICVALDRQHPRDLFDIEFLLENEGLTTEIRKALFVYLSSHNRLMAELLRPQFKDIWSIYTGEFVNMTDKDVPLKELLEVRERLVELIHEGMTDSEREFLISFKNRKPNWTLLDLNGISELPAIKWKQMNLAKISDEKHEQALDKLKSALYA